MAWIHPKRQVYRIGSHYKPYLIVATSALFIYNVPQALSDKEYAAAMLELEQRRTSLLAALPADRREAAEFLRDALMTHIELIKRQAKDGGDGVPTALPSGILSASSASQQQQDRHQPSQPRAMDSAPSSARVSDAIRVSGAGERISEIPAGPRVLRVSQSSSFESRTGSALEHAASFRHLTEGAPPAEGVTAIRQQLPEPPSPGQSLPPSQFAPRGSGSGGGARIPPPPGGSGLGSPQSQVAGGPPGGASSPLNQSLGRYGVAAAGGGLNASIGRSQRSSITSAVTPVSPLDQSLKRQATSNRDRNQSRGQGGGPARPQVGGLSNHQCKHRRGIMN